MNEASRAAPVAETGAAGSAAVDTTPISEDTSAKALAGRAVGMRVALAGIVALALIIMGYRIGEPLGGFHGFNEAFYMLLARDYMALPLRTILTSPLDFNNPPLFALLLTIAFKLFGVSEAVARSVPVLFSLLSIVYTYKLGRLIYSERVGLVAAALLAVSPGFVLVGRNVQVDVVFVFFMLASLYHYIHSTKSEGVRSALLGGVFLGLGLLSKLPAVLLPAAIVLWHLQKTRNLSWIDRRFMFYAAGAFVVGAPWYLYQIVFNADVFLGSQSSLAGTFQVPTLGFLGRFLIAELYWALSPVLFLLGLSALSFIANRSGQRDRLVLIVAGAFAVFYLFYHFHSYYLLPLIPFMLLLVAVMLNAVLRDWRLLTAATLALVTISSFFAVAMLSTHEYGEDMFLQLKTFVESSPEKNAVLEVSELIRDNYGPLIEYYLPSVELRADKPEDFPKDRQVFWLLIPKNANSAYLEREGVYICTQTIVEPVALGYRVGATGKSFNPHYFSMATLRTQPSLDTLFGFYEERDPEMLLIDWTKNGTPSQAEVVW